ncbi:hypothetical protein V6N11_025052 [Hibiscus sabdariffa]|uniref:Uncharacterized protein n=1 Tax=Hibiscus sabdariffa TaxID=183260 RepID=A0ABR2QNW3_9ROSI
MVPPTKWVVQLEVLFGSLRGSSFPLFKVDWNYNNTTYGILGSIAILCVGDCDIVLSTIPRKVNMAADFMSKPDSSSSIAIYDSILLTPGLRDLLHRDSFGA